ncbi:MAG: DGQHR domain-containing protein [Burkholderiaceae bacterium]|nr:DGQHR domain-containing protein [Burkholderiaceae bacterium]
MPSDVLAQTCVVETRYENPMEGFQRKLDEKRAQEIADYIDSGFGTIPNSIVLSAQPDAELTYRSTSQTLRFKKVPKAFLILDGQHRVFGFALAKAKLRVPVVIYNGLTRSEEARLFIDINTKQRPVPNELLLDIKRLADDEDANLALLHDVFDMLNTEQDSPLLGLMSPAGRARGRISRVTFNSALNAIWQTIQDQTPEVLYGILRAYMNAWAPVLRANDASGSLTNATFFRAIMQLLPRILERVSLRHGHFYTVDNFSEALSPVFSGLKKNRLKSPGNSTTALYEEMKNRLERGFALPASR